MQITEENITPAIAKEWLATNPNNRPRKQRHIDRLAEDMTSGRWKQDGAPFRFDKNGVMLDGQHRCLAIARSGVTMKRAVVIRGLDPEAFTTMDTGSKRSTADALFVMKERYPGILSGAVGLVAAYIKSNTLDTRKTLPTTQECIDTLEACPTLRDSVSFVGAQKSANGRTIGSSILLMPGALMAALHYLFKEKSQPLADGFVTGMACGYDHAVNPSFHMLRERMLNNRISKAKLTREYVSALAVKAWNAERAKVPLKQLKFADDESFPTIR